MRKLQIAFSIALFSSSLLMAKLVPEFLSDVNSLKAEFTTQTETKSVKKAVKKRSKEESTIIHNRDIKIVKVIKFSDISNYSLSHKPLASLRRTGVLTRTQINTMAERVKAKKVLIYMASNTNYLYFYQN